jgi:2'-5' RNA ligase
VPTIGVAIAVPEPYGTELQDRRHAFGDPLAASIPTHVTLLPPTVIDDESLEVVTKHLESIAAKCSGFHIRLRGTGTFRPVSPVVFVQVAVGIASCEQLEAEVRSGPLRVDRSYPYHPHVTVAHDIAPESLDRAFDELADYEVEFDVTAFGLYEHGADQVWRLRRTFRLLDGALDRDA